MERPEGRPDAVRYPESMKVGEIAFDRYDSLITIAEMLLQVDFEKGENAWYRRQVGGYPGLPEESAWCYATRSKSVMDTLFFPGGHPLQGLSRYNWFSNPDGTQFGWLTDDAKKEYENVDEAIKLRQEAMAQTMSLLKAELEKRRAAFRRKGAPKA